MVLSYSVKREFSSSKSWSVANFEAEFQRVEILLSFFTKRNKIATTRRIFVVANLRSASVVQKKVTTKNNFERGSKDN